MPASADARHINFANFVRRAIDHARGTRDLSIDDIVELSGVSRSTIYRWQGGDWRQDPKGDEIRKFCDALDIPPEIAFMILWPGKTNRTAEPEPFPPDPDFDLILRRLRDPNVSDAEKYHIRETIRALAARTPGRRPRPVPDGETTSHETTA